LQQNKGSNESPSKEIYLGVIPKKRFIWEHRIVIWDTCGDQETLVYLKNKGKLENLLGWGNCTRKKAYQHWWCFASLGVWAALIGCGDY
jgi:hypothetical protein